MRVLVACEEPQEVCKAFRALGYEAYSADIQQCSGGHPEWHILGDVLPLIDGDCKFTTMDGTEHEIFGEWDLLIAFPPCTYLSNAGARWLFPNHVLNQDRYSKGLQAKAFFLYFYNAKCKRIAIENPVPSKVYDMPQATQAIQPYQFYGAQHPYTKKTLLWLKGLPELKPVCAVDPVGPYCPAGTSRKDRSKYGAAKRGDDAKNRAKTFHGIAKAMAEQWSM